MGYLTIGVLNPPEAGRATWATQVLESAMEKGLCPVLLTAQTGALTRFTIKAPPALEAWMRANCPSGLSLAEAAAGWIESARRAALGVDDRVAPASEVVDAGWLALVNADLHGLAQRAASVLAAGKVLAAEAATGTGKGRMIAALAWREVAAGQRVVVASPLGLARQLLEELALLAPPGAAQPVLLLGRSNFVDPARVWSFAESIGNQALMQWVDNGGQPMTPGTRALAGRMAGDLAWLLEDAQAVAEAEADSLGGFLLHEDAPESCPARAVYEACRSAVQDAPLVVCSHHFLAADARLWMMQGKQAEQAPDKVLLLPHRIDRLIVDEAHLLEQAFASIFAGSVHLRALRRRASEFAQKPKAAADALDALEREVGKVAAGGDVTGRLTDFPELAHAAGLAEAALAGRGRDGERQLRADVEVLHAIALGGPGMVQASLTPVRRYAVLTAGRDNLESIFTALWGRVGGAVLVSATLYGADDRAASLRVALDVPAARFVTAPPVIPAWISAPVVLAQPVLGVAPDDSAAWLDALAALVRKEAAAARGGVLVLLTSYTAVDGLAARLLELGERLIAQGGDLPGPVCVERFRVVDRPVWLGVGYAWTGVDLSDKSRPAAEDRLLETLIMPRVPFGTNRTLTHQRRVKRLGFPVEVATAAVMFRQGLGRLVRRQGVSGKRLVVCDDRLMQKGSVWAPIFMRLLGRYRREG
jgi:ATP-dependent DNA helicase DinG